MTRKEQIEKECIKRYGGADCTWAIGFYKGAEWADKVPSQKTEALLQTARNTFKTMAELIKITLKVLK